MKKYELVNYNEKTRFYQIKALASFSDVNIGDLGGFVKSENNLSHDGHCWIYGAAVVSGDATVTGNAWISGNAKVTGNAIVCGNVEVDGNARISNDARIDGRRKIIMVSGFGSIGRTTTFFLNKDGKVMVNCGCFNGTLDEFEEKVKETYFNNKLGEEYLAISKVVSYHFSSL